MVVSLLSSDVIKLQHEIKNIKLVTCENSPTVHALDVCLFNLTDSPLSALKDDNLPFRSNGEFLLRMIAPYPRHSTCKMFIYKMKGKIPVLKKNA